MVRRVSAPDPSKSREVLFPRRPRACSENHWLCRAPPQRPFHSRPPGSEMFSASYSFPPSSRDQVLARETCSSECSNKSRLWCHRQRRLCWPRWPRTRTAAFPKKSNWILRKIAGQRLRSSRDYPSQNISPEIPPSAIALHLPQVFLALSVQRRAIVFP